VTPGNVKGSEARQLRASEFAQFTYSDESNYSAQQDSFAAAPGP